MSLPFIAIGFFLFVIGAVIGSFLNVVIYRTVEGESWVGGRSRCDHCRKKIGWYDNIPLLSFFLLKGKCRHCHADISLAYPIVEFLTGSLFAWWFITGSFFFRLTLHPFSTLQPVFWLLVGLILLFIFISDWLYYIIPDKAVFTLLILALGYRILLVSQGIMQVTDFIYTLLSMIALVGSFGFLWFITKGKGFGMGDVKFAAPMALLLGWPKILIGTIVAFMLGAMIGILMVVFGKKKMNQPIPFGPFLVIGVFVGLVFGELIWSFYWSLLM